MPNIHENAPARRLAVVTGASAGLGVEFAHQLAAGGMDLLITARRKERLEAVAEELRERYRVNVTVLPADLSAPGEVSRLADALQNEFAVDLLVNNAGFGLYGNFWELERPALLRMGEVHTSASVSLTHAVLPGMIARRRGGLIQVASMAAFIPGRKAVMYGATKAFLVAFSQNLQSELRGSGVHVQALCPGFIRSEFHDVADMSGFDRKQIPGFLWLNARDVVAKSLAAIERGSGVVIPGFWYSLGGFFLRTALIGGLVRKIF
jgi:uncharacterized protein